MNAEAAGEDIVLTIVDVFSTIGRRIVVVAPIESGVLRSRETVEIWDGSQPVTTARATVELINSRQADPRTILLGDIDKTLLRTVRTPAPDPQDPSAAHHYSEFD
jgi:translation elongation factor EF-Tu-like GTPase